MKGYIITFWGQKYIVYLQLEYYCYVLMVTQPDESFFRKQHQESECNAISFRRSGQHL